MNRTYRVYIEGQTPLLLHNDNIEWADHLKEWRTSPENKKKSVAGDDRSPAFTWLGSLYEDSGVAIMPSDSLMRCLMEAGAQVPVPGGKHGKTFKSQTQSGMAVRGIGWPLLVKGASLQKEAWDHL